MGETSAVKGGFSKDDIADMEGRGSSKDDIGWHKWGEGSNEGSNIAYVRYEQPLK